MEQITLDQWMSWKEDIREKLQETAENFVYIGYRLKQIRDSGMYDGAADIFEFAQREYGLGKSTTSRFIAINEKYSEGGNSLTLKEEYRQFSSSKLAEMLTLPDKLCQLITEKTTIKEIRELKNFSKNEEELKEKDEEEQNGQMEIPVHTPFQKCVIDFFKDKKQVLNRVMELLACRTEENFHAAAELINPSGQCSHKKGIIFLFMYDYSTGVKYKNLTIPEPVTMNWGDFLGQIYDIYYDCMDGSYGTGKVHQNFYGEEKVLAERESEKTKEETSKVEKTQITTGAERSVATSQQEEKREEKTNAVTMAEKVERQEEKEENSGAEAAENEEGMEESSQPEADLESGDIETGADVIEDGEGAAVLSPEISESESENHENEPEKGEDGPENHENEPENDEEVDTFMNQPAAVEEADIIESGTSIDYRATAEKVETDVKERISQILTDVSIAVTSRDWRNIKLRLNNLSMDIDTLVRYLEQAEDEEEGGDKRNA